MVEEIITALSRFKSLFVVARNSSFTFKGRAVDFKEVGCRLGVRYVLEGSVRKASGKVRITGQLIDALTGRTFGRIGYLRKLSRERMLIELVTSWQPEQSLSGYSLMCCPKYRQERNRWYPSLLVDVT
jgi:hypothetical protein